MTTSNSLRPQGPWEVRRRIIIPGISQHSDVDAVEKILTEISGVRAVRIDESKHTATVRYEVTETDYCALEEALKTAGFESSPGWWARRKANWYQNLDLTGRENAGVRPSPCCNKPPRDAR